MMKNASIPIFYFATYLAKMNTTNKYNIVYYTIRLQMTYFINSYFRWLCHSAVNWHWNQEGTDGELFLITNSPARLVHWTWCLNRWNRKTVDICYCRRNVHLHSSCWYGKMCMYITIYSHFIRTIVLNMIIVILWMFDTINFKLYNLRCKQKSIHQEINWICRLQMYLEHAYLRH